MIFRLTPEKVINRVNRLIDYIGPYDLKIKEYEEEADLMIRNGISMPGDDSSIREWRLAWDEIYGSLADARHELRQGNIDFREVNRMLPSVRTAMRHFDRVFKETDAAADLGRAAFRARFRNA